MTGPQAGLSGRPVGWDLPDHDVAVIDSGTLAVSYLDRLMTNDMALAVHPVSGDVTVVGTEATNEIRFEPNLTSTFVRVHLAMVDPATGTNSILDLNDHLDYLTSSIPQVERELAIGDPRAIVWNAAGTRAWVAGKGSANLVEIDGSGSRTATGTPIAVGEGPTGLALDEARGRLYVHQHFEGSVGAVDIATNTLVDTVPFHDPTPAAVKIGARISTTPTRRADSGRSPARVATSIPRWTASPGTSAIRPATCAPSPGTATTGSASSGRPAPRTTR